MNTKEKGNIGEAIAVAEFTKYGAQVSIPFGDNARYDLIAEFNGKLNKIQIKYCGELVKSGAIACVCESKKNHTTNKNKCTYENEIDYFVFYLAQWDIPILVPFDYIGNKRTVYFRHDKPKTNQSNVNYIDNFTFDKIIKTLK